MVYANTTGDKTDICIIKHDVLKRNLVTKFQDICFKSHRTYNLSLSKQICYLIELIIECMINLELSWLKKFE